MIRKTVQKYEFFPRWQTKSLFFFLPSVKIIEYFPPFGNKAVTLQAEKIQENKETRRR